MQTVPIELTEANAFVKAIHRHHGEVQGHRFSIGVIDGEKLVGVAIVGRPVGGSNPRTWAEVTRLCTDGTRNACSHLYSAAARAAQAMGYERIQTYILNEENGASLKASGWQFDRLSHPVGWHHEGGRGAREVKEHLAGRKQLWFRDLAPQAPEWRDSLPQEEKTQMSLEIA